MSKAIQLTVKLRDVAEGDAALKRIASENISGRMAYTISLVLTQTEPHLHAQGQARKALLKRYGTPVEKQPGSFFVPPEKREAYEQEWEKLLDEPVVLTGIGRIRVSALEAEGLKLSGEEVYTLRWLLKSDVVPMFEEGDETPEG